MRTYEVLFILSPQVTEEEATTLITDFKGIAEKNGATFTNEEAWGRRRLAYPINKSNEGIYHLFVLESDSSLSELDRRMKNVDRVLRHVIVRTDLEHKRADKLAKRNPKKERVRPAMPSAAPYGAAAPERITTPDPVPVVDTPVPEPAAAPVAVAASTDEPEVTTAAAADEPATQA
jgi:small subunit ribosomal protein S6